jgi:hypothetical protein
MVVKIKAKEPKVAKAETKPEVKETKEGKLVKLLSGKESFTLKEIVARTGFAEASAKMYVNQEYLRRKGKPYKVVTGKKGKEDAYRFEVGHDKK